MNEENGGNNMVSDNVGLGQAGTLAVLADTARAGRGGYWGGEGGGFGSGYANLSAIQHTNLANRDIAQTGIENLQREFSFANTNDRNQNSFERICDKLSQNDIRNTDNQFRAELRTNDRIAALQAEVTQNAKEAALCCCKLEAQAAQNYGELKSQNAVILAKIDSNKEIAELRAELQTQKIFSTCGCGCGGGVKPCPGS